MTQGAKRDAALLKTLAAAGLLLLAGGCAKRSVATVNGDAITRDEFYHRVLNYTDPMQQGVPAGMQILNNMITENLVLAEARREGVMPTDAEVDERINLVSKQMPSKAQGLKQQLQQAGLTLDDIRQQMRVHLAEQKLITKGITVSDAEVRKFYDDNKAKLFSTPAQVRGPGSSGCCSNFARRTDCPCRN